ncbi:MAG: hypothetical protein QM759_11680 [Terricaulis sp.]
MAKISAGLALLASLVIVVSICFDMTHWGFGTIGPVATAALLVLGSERTLRGKSGGLRMLCGAWGMALGMAWFGPSYNFPDFLPGALAIGAPVLVSAIGLALVVLYKEPPKKPAAA